MKKLWKILLALAVLCLAGVLAFRPRSNYWQITGYAQGGTYIVKFGAGKLRGRQVQELKSSVDSLLAVIDRSISGYNPGSLLSKYNAGEDVVPDDVFLRAYDAARYFYEMTGGVVDCAAGEIFDLWGFGFKEGKMPSDAEVERALASCGMKLLPPSLLDAISQPRRVPLNFNAIAQGLSSDMVAELLVARGVENFLVNIGGEIACGGRNDKGKAWTIGIDNPVDGNEVSGSDVREVIEIPAGYHGVVTSGDYRKFYIENGVKYAHTIDPRTGRPAHSDILSATIIAPTSLEADALATYAMVVGRDEATRFFSARDDIQFYFIQ